MEDDGGVVLYRLICVSILNDSVINKNYCHRITFFKKVHCHRYLVCNNDISSNYPLSGIIIRIYINFILLTSHKSVRKKIL